MCVIPGCSRFALPDSQYCQTCGRAFERGRTFGIELEPPVNSVWVDRNGVAWLRTITPGPQCWGSGISDEIGLNWAQIRCRGGELIHVGKGC